MQERFFRSFGQRRCPVEKEQKKQKEQKIMKKLRQMSPKKTMILYGVCAVLWTAFVVMDVMDRAYAEDVVQFALKAICLPVWIAGFVVMFKRYRKSKDEEQK